MNWSTWIRRIHRWVGLAFTVILIANIAALVLKAQVLWLGLAALVPVVFLTLSGLYMFALPYVGRRRTPERTQLAAADTR